MWWMVAAFALELEAGPLVPGQPLTLTLSGASPNEAIDVGLGSGVGAGPCLPNQVCLGITGGVRRLAQVRADAAGGVVLTIPVPNTLQDGSVAWLQAVGRSSAMLSSVVRIEARSLATVDPAPGGVHVVGTLGFGSWVARSTLAGAEVHLTGAHDAVVGIATGGAQTIGMHMPISTATGAYRWTAGAASSEAFTLAGFFGFWWDGSAEQMGVYDFANNTVVPRGTVGDLLYWSGQTVFEPLSGELYVAGYDPSGDAWLYVMDPGSGGYLGRVPLWEGLQGAQRTNAGMIATFGWNGVEEEMRLLDPGTGAVTVIGTVGTLATWTASTAYDADADIVYVLGWDDAGVQHIWAMDATSGALLGAAEPDSDVGGGLAFHDGSLLGCRWNGAFEEIVRTDPTSGHTEVIGDVGELASWNGVARIAGDRYYVWGYTAQGDPRVWVARLSHGGGMDAYGVPVTIGIALAW